MRLHPKYHLTMEAIAYQGRSLLFHDLTIAFREFMALDVQNEREFAKLNLAGIVKRHTGLTVDFKLDTSPGMESANAYAIPVVLDVNNPLLSPLRNLNLDSTINQFADGHSKISTYVKDLRGSLDLAKSKVTGVFAQIPTTMAVGVGLWKYAGMSAEEVAAIALHEIGHIFTYFEALLQSASTNMVLATATAALAKTEDEQVRLKLVFETQQLLNAKVEDPKALAKADVSAEVFSSIMLKSMIDSPLHAATGSTIYDMRSAEFVADQFAARHGAGRALVIALDKLHRKVSPDYRRHIAMHMLTEGVRVGATLAVAIAFPVTALVLGTLLLTFTNPEFKVYDDPGERLHRIKNDLVQSLKNTKLAKEKRKQLLDDIEFIDSVREGVKDRRSVFTYLWIAVSSKRRDQFHQMRIQQELEGIANNDLFVQSSKLQSMAQ